MEIIDSNEMVHTNNSFLKLTLSDEEALLFQLEIDGVGESLIW